MSKEAPWLKKYQYKEGDNTGDENHKWKGDEVGYVALHLWVYRHFGQPDGCERCGTTDKRMYQWANISNKYLRDRSDWFRMCVPCHRRFDYEKKLERLRNA